MRLKPEQVEAFIQVLEPILQEISAELFLHGSRVDDNQKGGDIDLLLLVPQKHYSSLREKKNKMIIQFQKQKSIGERRIDLLIADESKIKTDPFLSAIYPKAISLKKW